MSAGVFIHAQSNIKGAPVTAAHPSQDNNKTLAMYSIVLQVPLSWVDRHADIMHHI